MKEFIIYIAFDGEEFFSKKECLNYENNYRFLAEQLVKNVSFYDDNKELLEIDITKDMEDILRQIDIVYDKAKYVKFEDISTKQRVKIAEECSISLPPKAGFYEYDDYDGWRAV